MPTHTNHQQLFDAYIRAERIVSSEFSGTIHADAEDLLKWAATYASNSGLVAPTDPEYYGIYCEYEDCAACMERSKG